MSSFNYDIYQNNNEKLKFHNQENFLFYLIIVLMKTYINYYFLKSSQEFWLRNGNLTNLFFGNLAN